MLKSNNRRNAMPALSWSQVSAFRLHRHHLACRAPLKSLVRVVGDICGVQAQSFSAAQMALWARVQDLTPEDVERVLWRERTLVKTWCMRQSVHLLAARELLMYMEALKRSGLRAEGRWITRFGVSSNEVEAMTDAIVEALADGPLTRAELTERVVSLLGRRAERWVGHSWGGVVKQACLRGLACFGPNRGQKITFVRRDQWLPHLNDMSSEEAENTLFQRYLHSYGPASLQDFAAWTGMAMKDVLPIRQRLGDEVIQIAVEDRAGLILRQDLLTMKTTKATELAVRLLPSFDSYLLGHRDKRHLVDEAYYKRVYRKAGWLSPVVLVNGRVAGVWSYEHRGRQLCLKVEKFGRITRAVRAQIEAEASNLGHFLGSTCEVTFI